MPKTVPTPVSAALGLVPTVLDGVRRLPTKAVQLPVLALSSALTGMDLARREYDELSQRGERLVARLRGTSFDELEDKVEDSLAGTPLAKPYDAIEDAVEDVVEAVRTGGRKPRAATPERPSSDDTPVAEAEQPKGEPTPKATEPDSTRIDTAATADVVAAVEEVAAGVVVPSNLTAADLPLADYDHLTLGRAARSAPEPRRRPARRPAQLREEQGRPPPRRHDARQPHRQARRRGVPAERRQQRRARRCPGRDSSQAAEEGARRHGSRQERRSPAHQGPPHLSRSRTTLA